MFPSIVEEPLTDAEQQECDQDLLELKSWLSEARAGDLADREAQVDACLDLLSGDDIDYEGFAEQVLQLRRGLELSTLEQPDDLLMIGLIELDSDSGPADFQFYSRCLQHNLDFAKHDEEARLILEEWRDQLEEYSLGRLRVDRSQVRPVKIRWRAHQQIQKGLRSSTTGPSEWPALNVLLHSGLSFPQVAEWFLAQLSPLLVIPGDAAGTVLSAAERVRDLALGLQDYMHELLQDFHEEPVVGGDLNLLLEKGILVKKAFDEFEEAKANAHLTPCIRCGHRNEPHRTQCGQCSARLIVNSDHLLAARSSQTDLSGQSETEPGIPPIFQELLGALDHAQAGRWDTLEEVLSRFIETYERWLGSIERSPLMTTPDETLVEEVRDKVQILKDWLGDFRDRADSTLDELEQVLSARSLSQIPQLRHRIADVGEAFIDLQSIEPPPMPANPSGPS